MFPPRQICRSKYLYCVTFPTYPHQIWVGVWSHVEGRLWSFAVICLSDGPSLTPYRPLTNALRLIRPGTCSGQWLMVHYCLWRWLRFFFILRISKWTSTFPAVLPESLFLRFDCGVRVQLGFAAEFSNVMVIYTRILEKPEEIVSCCAQLTDFPEVCSLIL